MGAKAVFCIAGDETQATAIIQDLRTAGFTNDQISALVPDRTGPLSFGFERHTKVPEGASLGGLLGGCLAAAFGWFLSSGWLPLGVPARLLVGGPAMTTLSAAAVGILLGALFGALFGMRRAEYEAKRYGGTLNGNILLSACCDSFRSVRQARRIFRQASARHIGVAPIRFRGMSQIV